MCVVELHMQISCGKQNQKVGFFRGFVRLSMRDTVGTTTSDLMLEFFSMKHFIMNFWSKRSYQQFFVSWSWTRRIVNSYSFQKIFFIVNEFTLKKLLFLLPLLHFFIDFFIPPSYDPNFHHTTLLNHIYNTRKLSAIIFNLKSDMLRIEGGREKECPLIN